MSIIRADSIKNRSGTGAPDFPNGITVTGIVTSTVLDASVTNLTVTGNLGVGGTVTYEDVTNVDSIGVGTFRDGLRVTGICTATAFHGNGSALTGIDATSVKDSGGNVKIQAEASGAVYTGIHTFTGHTFHQDNDHAKFGTGGDMTIYHDGSNAYLKENTNNMHIGSWSSSSNKGLFLYSAGTNRCAVNNDGHFVPAATNTYDLGNSSARWRNLYTQDLQLSNESSGGNDVDGTWGNYTIQEGESDLFLINNRNGKKYKFMLKEVD